MSARQRMAAAVLAVVAGAAQAGRPCNMEALDVQSVEQAMGLAERTAAWLDASEARVVAIARVGQDLSRHGLHYSHFGLAYREHAGQPWRVVHKLNHCGSATAAVYRQGLGDFFLDRMHRYEAGIVVLAPELQARLLPLLHDDVEVARWHAARYSMVAYPWAQTYQQSNQWALETLAGAMEPAAATRRQAQAWLQLRDYRPTVLRIGALTRLGARVTAANVAFDDHPDEQRYAGRIETVTVDSVFGWLQRSGLGGETIHLH